MQNPSIFLSKVQVLFETVCQILQSTKNRVKPNCATMANPEFETATIKVWSMTASILTHTECKYVEHLLKQGMMQRWSEV